MTLEQDIGFLKMMTFGKTGEKNPDEILKDINDNGIVQKYFLTESDGQNFTDHVFKGFQVKNGIFDGHHSEYLYPLQEDDVSRTGNLDKSKAYKVHIGGKGYTTFFPIQMPCEDIIVAALLVYQNPDKVQKDNSYEAYVNEYRMRVKIIMIGQKISNAYPVI